MGLGVSYQDKALEYQQRSSARMSRTTYTQRDTEVTQTTTSITKDDGDILSLSHNSGCTDGKNDSKIGLFGVIGNLAIGAGKSIVNGIRGCFTDSNGNFSLGKTLLTVATGALCVACPAVGLVACGVGAVAGGAQVIKGIGKVASAETDAEAKEAWQNIGAGGFTAASSVVGAKAALGAVKGTSTAGLADVAKTAGKAIDKADDVANISTALKSSGINNADDVANAIKALDKADDVAGALKNIDGLTPKQIDAIVKAVDKGEDATSAVIRTMGQMDDASALTLASQNLDDGATAMQKTTAYGKALAKDMASSTKNRTSGAMDVLKAQKAARKEVSSAKETLKTASKEQADALKEYNKATEALKNADPNADNYSQLLDDFTNAEQALRDVPGNADVDALLKANETVTNYQGVVGKAKQGINKFKENRQTSEHAQAKKDLKAAKEALAEAKKNGASAQDIADLEHAVSASESVVKETAAITKAINNIKNYKELPGKISESAKGALEFLKSGEGTYAEAVQKFGYNNVLEALEVVGGYRLADEAV